MDEINALGLRLAELWQKYGIAELSVFGSVARGDSQPDSDFDLLYVMPRADLWLRFDDSRPAGHGARPRSRMPAASRSRLAQLS